MKQTCSNINKGCSEYYHQQFCSVAVAVRVVVAAAPAVVMVIVVLMVVILTTYIVAAFKLKAHGRQRR